MVQPSTFKWRQRDKINKIICISCQLMISARENVPQGKVGDAVGGGG